MSLTTNMNDSDLTLEIHIFKEKCPNASPRQLSTILPSTVFFIPYLTQNPGFVGLGQKYSILMDPFVNELRYI